MHFFPKRPKEDERKDRIIKMLELTALGWTAQEIGKELFLSDRTVETYLWDLVRLNGYKNKTHMIAVAIWEGVIKAPVKTGAEDMDNNLREAFTANQPTEGFA